MDRQSILCKYTYKKEHHLKTKLADAKKIEKVDQHFLEELFGELSQHQSILNSIKRSCADSIDILKSDDVNKLTGYYFEAFHFEKQRFIAFFENQLRMKKQFKAVLMSPESNVFDSPSAENQLELYKLIEYVCNKWHDLLLHQEFDDQLSHPKTFHYELRSKRF